MSATQRRHKRTAREAYDAAHFALVEYEHQILARHREFSDKYKGLLAVERDAKAALDAAKEKP